MAFLCSRNLLISILVMISLHQVVYVSSLEFQVADTTGWAVPPSNDTNFYNNWASNMRFRIGDTIRFKYKKDSVMEVTENEYKKCNSTRPHLFSNTGNTMFTLDRSGYFYFVSGAAGHCERGERMIVRVLVQDVINDYSAASAPAAFALFQQLYALPLVFLLFLSFLY